MVIQRVLHLDGIAVWCVCVMVGCQGGWGHI